MHNHPSPSPQPADPDPDTTSVEPSKLKLPAHLKQILAGIGLSLAVIGLAVGLTLSQSGQELRRFAFVGTPIDMSFDISSLAVETGDLIQDNAVVLDTHDQQVTAVNLVITNSNPSVAKFTQFDPFMLDQELPPGAGITITDNTITATLGVTCQASSTPGCDAPKGDRVVVGVPTLKALNPGTTTITLSSSSQIAAIDQHGNPQPNNVLGTIGTFTITVSGPPLPLPSPPPPTCTDCITQYLTRGDVYTRSKISGTWTAWSALPDSLLTGTGVIDSLMSSPSVKGYDIQFLARGGQLYRRDNETGWNSWQNVTSNVTSVGSGRITAFITALNVGGFDKQFLTRGGTVWARDNQSGSWSTWLSTDPSTWTGTGTATITAFCAVKDPNGGNFTKQYLTRGGQVWARDNQSGWSAWTATDPSTWTGTGSNTITSFCTSQGEPLASSAIPGDADSDGQITLLDFNIWFNAYQVVYNGGDATDFRADWDGDGDITLLDYNIWFNAYQAVFAQGVPL